MSAGDQSIRIRVGAQPLVLVLGLAAWSCAPSLGFVWLVGAYGMALIVVNICLHRQWLKLPVDLTPGPAALGAIVLVGMVAVGLARRAGSSLDAARDWVHVQKQRQRLTSVPSIFPGMIVDNRPQRFWIHAAPRSRVSLRWPRRSGNGSVLLRGVELGQGLFYVDYNPRAHGLAAFDGDRVDVALTVDSRQSKHEMKVWPSRPRPQWWASAPQAGWVATCSTSTDEVILLRRDGSHKRVPVDDGPSGCVFFNQGKHLLVVLKYSPTLVVLDVESGVVRSRQAGPVMALDIAASPDRSRVAIAVDGPESRIELRRLSDLVTTGSIALSVPPRWVRFGMNGDQVVVASNRQPSLHLYERDASLDALAAEGASLGLELPDNAVSAWRPSERGPIVLPRAPVCLSRGQHDSSLFVSATTTRTGDFLQEGNHFIQGAILRVNLQRWEVDGAVVTDRRTGRQDDPGNVDSRLGPTGLYALGEHHLVATFAGSGEIGGIGFQNPGVEDWVRAVDQGMSEGGGKIPGLDAPNDIGHLGEGIWAVSSPATGRIGLLDRNRGVFQTISLVSQSASDTDLRRMHGEISFYEATRSGISCHSCHTHGDSDYGLHDIGGPRPWAVLSVRGVAGTPPYLRDGSYNSLGALHRISDDGDLLRGYRRQVDWDRAAAVSSYIESLPPPVNWRWLEPATDSNLDELRLGTRAFVKAGCIRCHAFSAMTRLGTHLARNLFGDEDRAGDGLGSLDTPSLLGVWRSAPYLHDGRASSLREVLVAFNRSNRHGNVAALSDEELDAMITFLLSL
ncbi:MAG: hypothetical protein R3236_05185 [Phycisphaeraceae bacterium]|nr:hypothetical protein [Phycisphaeraceae bacterium]